MSADRRTQYDFDREFARIIMNGFQPDEIDMLDFISQALGPDTHSASRNADQEDGA